MLPEELDRATVLNLHGRAIAIGEAGRAFRRSTVSIDRFVAVVAFALAFLPVVAAAEVAAGAQEAGKDQSETYSCGELLCGGPVVLEKRRDNLRFFPFLRALPGMGIGVVTGTSGRNDRHWIGGTIHDSWMGSGHQFALTLESGASPLAVGYIGAPLSGGAVFWFRLQ